MRDDVFPIPDFLRNPKNLLRDRAVSEATKDTFYGGASKDAAPVVKSCLWSQADVESGCWETSCGQAFNLNDGSPSDNYMKFCCYCGGALSEERALGEDDDD